ncbi:hypothetical protein ACS0TY_029738 [Phlomoides rotata]
MAKPKPKRTKMVPIRPCTSSPSKRIQGLGPPPLPHPQYKAFFLEKWNNYCIEGWAAFRLKEKLKLFKSDLRGWNKVIFGDIDYNIDTKKEEIEILDQIDDQWKEKFLAQKAKARWLREGDVNSSYFHVWINRNRKSNTIEGLLINDRWINSVKGVKKWIHEHFENHFKAPHSSRPNLPLDIFSRTIDEVTLRQGEGDVWRWRHSRDGLFSTATAVRQVVEELRSKKISSHSLERAT